MWTPKTIEEFLDERIKFCKTAGGEHAFVEIVTGKTNEKNITASDFRKVLVDFEYCKKLLIQSRENPNDTKIEDKFKRLALRHLVDCWGNIVEQQKGWISQENKDDFKEFQDAFEKIFQDLKIEMKHIY